MKMLSARFEKIPQRALNCSLANWLLAELAQPAVDTIPNDHCHFIVWQSVRIKVNQRCEGGFTLHRAPPQFLINRHVDAHRIPDGGIRRPCIFVTSALYNYLGRLWDCSVHPF
jgi:hypothetical protein